MQKMEEKNRDKQKRYNLNLATHGQEQAAKGWPFPDAQSSCQDEKHHHNWIGVPVKARDHERDRAQGQEKQSPGRYAKRFGDAEQNQHNHEIGQYSRKTKQKWKRHAMIVH